ncbi:MAG: aldose 1-epimerase family protein [Deinococcales bacterium]|nr:aldose 1-epimerase family protein [Chitinophagaceae bacterium]
MITISNDILNVTIAAKGAELQSIYNKQTRLEYMWDADPNFWAKRSPVLFPIVGGLKNNSYEYNGKQYQLPRHGFARDMAFEVENQTENSVTFFIQSSAETLLIYPFEFKFSVVYTIKNNQLTVTYIVENKSKEKLYFSVGAHPAFKVPLVSGDSYTDYYLQFSNTETTGIYPLSTDGLIELEPLPMLDNTNQLPLTKQLFFKDALVFKTLQSTSISILNNKNTNGLKLSYQGFPYMGIWAAKNADFVCIEPWCGIADNVNTSGKLEEKDGINALDANENFTRSWVVELF